MAQTAKSKSAREASLERRRALTTKGKAALTGGKIASSSQPKQSTTVVVNAAAQASSMTGRAASRARRDAMSSSGKAGLAVKDRVRSAPAKKTSSAPSKAVSTSVKEDKPNQGCGCGCNGTNPACADTPNTEQRSHSLTTSKSMIIPSKKKQTVARSAARIASLARREATSARGKAGINSKGISAAQTARAANPGLSSRELAKALRETRSRMGRSGQKKSEPCGRKRANKSDNDNGAAKDAPWKVGESETTLGQTLTGTMVGRSRSVTGDEASTCRDVTGTEYMGADVFRDFCQSDPKASTARKVNITSTSHGNTISGDRVGRGKNVTGNEAGTCKIVTGDEYISAEQSQGYCGEFAKKSPRKVSMAETMKGKAVTGNKLGRSGKVTGDESGMNRSLTGTQYTKPEEIGNAPAKVGASTTLRGGSVTGSMIGRRERMTGDEAGSCRNITGDDYIGKEQYNGFCSTTADAPTDQKVGISTTGKGLTVTGTLTGRVNQVTGNEPGSCKAVTGTPYGGTEQLQNFCQAEDVAMVNTRNKTSRSTPAMPLTGLQPGIGGVMTGTEKGACEQVSGTPYVGADQFADACPATPATSASPDFPQAISGSSVGQQFSINTPSGGAAPTTLSRAARSGKVTGGQNGQSHITGPFGMASGKVTGTEEARFAKDNVNAAPMQAAPLAQVDGRQKARISGEGQDSGLNITGDDWSRGNNVTGTEGMSTTKRNPTLRATNPMAAMQEMAAIAQKRNEEIAVPNSKITGSSGNTDKGSLITYSGGARG